jgi:hypothetical protein
MIISSLIFFDASFQKRIVYFGKCFHIPLLLFENGKEKAQHSVYKTKKILFIVIAFQLLFHFRYLYTQMKFLTEEADSLGALC